MASLHFVIGGARSGKSAFAEELALAKKSDRQATYIATAEIFDDGFKISFIIILILSLLSLADKIVIRSIIFLSSRTFPGQL